MKISVAQTQPIKGNIEANILNHKQLINLAIAEKVEIIIFPELSIPEHSANAFQHGANIYIASTVNSYNGVQKDLNILANIAQNYSMTVLMAHCIGQTGEYNCTGNSSVWNNKGSVLGQMDDKHEGIMIFDAKTEILTKNLI